MSSHELKSAAEALVAAEHGTIHKHATFRCALVYPSPYRAGMSSLGFQLLYREVNARAEWSAERAFLPDNSAAHRESRTPLFTLEALRPVVESHVIGISLAYELEIAGMIECLELADLAPLAADRHPDAPLVVLGGPLTFSNPLPAAPFADIVVMGEGEELIHRILDEYEGGATKEEICVRLSTEPGIYVPAIHGERLKPVAAADNRKLPAYSQIITPNTELANMHLVEAERGCHRKCTYCVMRRSTNGGMRLAEPDDIIASIPEHAQRVGLVGAAVSDHPKLLDIVTRVTESGRGIGLSSLRADRLTDPLVEALAAGGYRTLTVSSDGASERLRKSLQKAIREKHLFAAAELAAKHRMRFLKVYMMVGAPGETDEDIDELIAFCREVSRIAPTALGIAPFVAKRNTPLDRADFAGIKPVERTLKRLQRELRGVVDLRSTSARWAWVEWCFAQGGFDMAHVALQAYRNGGGFAAYKRAIREHRRDEQPADADLRLGYPEGRFASEGYS